MILGLFGAMRAGEIHKLSLVDVRDSPDSIFVETKTNVNRGFSITGPMSKLMRKYLEKRIKIVGCKPLLLLYRNGRCIKQAIGINTIYAVPSKIAEFLGLPEPKLYTGHAFRRSSATILANTGADLTRIKRLGGWTSNVAENYIVESESRQIENANSISAAIEGQSSVGETKNQPEPEQEEEKLARIIFGNTTTITGTANITITK